MHYPTWTEIGVLIGALSAAYAAYKGHTNGSKLGTLEIRMDGRMDQLLNVTKVAATADGVQQEKDRDKTDDLRKSS
jgi:hypothetical protein